jgi:hypothetical protein
MIVVVMGGFALVNNNKVTILVNEAELGSVVNIMKLYYKFYFIVLIIFFRILKVVDLLFKIFISFRNSFYFNKVFIRVFSYYQIICNFKYILKLFIIMFNYVQFVNKSF